MKSAAGTAIFATLLAAFCWSLNGLIVRSIEAMDYWQIASYRAVGVIVGGSVLLAVRHGRRFAGGFNAAIVAGSVLNALASVSYIFGILNTTVANVSIVLSTAPLLAAVAATLFIGERINMSLLIFSFVACLGVVVMFFGAAGSSEGTIGIAGAMMNVLGFVGIVCLIRSRQHLDMLVAIFGGSIITAIAGFTLSAAPTPPLHDIVICLVWGAIPQTAGFVLTIYAAKHITTAEITCILLLEYLLAPFWVFLALNESPSPSALVGGTITLCAVLAGVVTMARSRRTTAPHIAEVQP